jgi:N-acetylglucosaminyl-diphospho-decaprenol L-rhamnosyltransferase
MEANISGAPEPSPTPSPGLSAEPSSTPQPARDPEAAGAIDVVIVSADTREMTSGCVAELLDPELGGARLARVIVVDNASTDGTAQALTDAFDERVEVVRLDHACGFAAACNRGAERGQASYVLFLNSDILLTPDAIGCLLRELRTRPQAVAAGGRLVDPETLSTQPQYRPRRFPTLANFAVILLGIEERWPDNPVTRRYHGEGLDDVNTRTVQQPAAAALLVTRPALEGVAGFDERFWFWFEDSDLLARLSLRGAVLYVPSAAFRHLGGGTFRRWSKSERIRSVHHGIVRYGEAHFSRVRRMTLGLLLLAVSEPRVMLFARTRPEETRAWRAVARAGRALVRGREAPAIAP